MPAFDWKFYLTAWFWIPLCLYLLVTMLYWMGEYIKVRKIEKIMRYLNK